MPITIRPLDGTGPTTDLRCPLCRSRQLTQHHADETIDGRRYRSWWSECGNCGHEQSMHDLITTQETR